MPQTVCLVPCKRKLAEVAVYSPACSHCCRNKHLTPDYCEHVLDSKGIGAGSSPIGCEGFVKANKVQGSSLLLSHANNFVGYSYVIYDRSVGRRRGSDDQNGARRRRPKKRKTTKKNTPHSPRPKTIIPRLTPFWPLNGLNPSKRRLTASNWTGFSAGRLFGPSAARILQKGFRQPLTGERVLLVKGSFKKASGSL